MIHARLTFEANQHLKGIGPMGMGSEYLGRGFPIGNDYWIVGTEVKDRKRVYRVTVRGNEYGGGEKYQRIWFVDPAYVQNCRIPVPAEAE